MSLPPEITLEEFRHVVEMLRTTLAGMADLADRVKALEETNEASLAAYVALKDSQQHLFETYKAQQQINVLFREGLDNLLAAIGNNDIKN
jgi:hypothetical protein